MRWLLPPLLLALMAVCSFGPGFFFVRRLKWSPAERLCASIGLSLVMVYLAGTAIYLLHLSWSWCWLVSAAAVALTLRSWHDFKKLWAVRAVRRQVAGFACLLLGSFLLLSLVRHYSGAFWGGDWFEHYQRVRFFLEYWPADTPFPPNYILPSRPPMMNILAACFLAQTDHGFDLFQLVFLFLNLLVFFPCALLAGLLVKRGGRQLWLLVAVLTASATFQENATYTWTKLLAAFYVLLALALYLRGWRKNESGRMIAAVAGMATGLLVHYSAGPWAVVFALHYLLIFPRRRGKLIEVLGGAGVGAALLATWFAWSLAIYGVKTTLDSNTSVNRTQELSLAGNLLKIGHNLVNTFVPHPLRISSREFQTLCDQPNAFGYLRDFFFVIYQQNFPTSLGLVAWTAVLFLLTRQLRRTGAATRLFWALFIGLGLGLGIAVHGAYEPYGVAHICLQPLILFGLTLLAAGFFLLPHWLRCAVALAMVPDVALGILLHFRMQMHVFPVLTVNGIQILPLSRGLLNQTAVQSFLLKQTNHFVFWGDHCSALTWLIVPAVIALLGLAVVVTATAAWSGPVCRPFRLPPFARLVGIFYLSAVAVCFADRLAGYRIDPEPAAAINFSQAQIDRMIEPAYRAASADPHSSQLQYDLGAVYYRLVRRRSEDCFIEAFLLDPCNRRARYALQLFLFSHGRRLSQTDALYAETVRLNPGDIDNQSMLAAVLYRHGHKDQARQRLLDTVRAHPDSWELRDRLAILLTEMGLIDEAIGQSKRALALKPGAVVLVKRLRTLLAARGTDAASIDRIISGICATGRSRFQQPGTSAEGAK